jgi:hypothetical protein
VRWFIRKERLIRCEQPRVVFFINYRVMEQFKCSFAERIFRRVVVARDDIATRQRTGI